MLALLVMAATAVSTGASAGPPRRDPLAGARRVTGRERPYHVAFTFDDGPSHTTTPAVLDALERFGVPAAFFVVGRRVSGVKPQAVASAAVLADIRARGHLIGNHTLRHEDLSLVSATTARGTIAGNQVAIARKAGGAPSLFRPPFGRVGSAGAVLRASRMTVVGWSIDPRDFVEEAAGSLRARVVEEIVRNRGGVVLLHDTRPWTARELPGILADLEAENCRRRATGQRLIVPVSLHYFLRERSGRARPVPPAVAAATTRYVVALARRCGGRVDKRAGPH